MLGEATIAKVYCMIIMNNKKMHKEFWKREKWIRKGWIYCSSDRHQTRVSKLQTYFSS